MVDIDKSVAHFVRHLYQGKLTNDLQEKASAAAIKIGASFRDASLTAELEQIAADVLALRRDHTVSGAMSLVETFLARGWITGANLIYTATVSNLAEPPPTDFIRLAPTAKALSSVTRKFQITKRELEAIALREPQAAASSAVADWWLQHGKVRQLKPVLLATLRRDKRRKGLMAPEVVLRSTLQRDKKGVLLQQLLAIDSEAEQLIDRIAAVLVASPKIAKSYLPVVRSPRFQKSSETGLLSLIRALARAGAINRETTLVLRTASVFLLALIPDGLITTLPENPLPRIVYEALRALHDIANAAVSEGARQSVWVAHPLAEPPKDGNRTLVDLDAAKVLKIAFDHVQRGTDTLSLLESTAFNLGLRPFEEPGSRVNYDPLVHEDTVGGLLPEDKVEVIRKGWILGDSIVIKALVRTT